MPRRFVDIVLFTSLFVGKALVLAKPPRDPAFPLSPGFDIQQIAEVASTIPSHSWEFGTAAETLLELRDPDISVFGSSPFSSTSRYLRSNRGRIEGLEYAASTITIGTGVNGLADGGGAVGDPASLGVSAVLLGDYLPNGQGREYADAAAEEVDFVMNQAPRWDNGAISHRVEQPELWADFIYMAPPFLAYYAVHTSNLTLLQATVEQCGLYREILQTRGHNGRWAHIRGPAHPDPGLWSTGNAWAAAGMTRVLATVIKSPGSLTARHEHWKSQAVDSLTTWIKEILDGAIESPLEDGLLRNYLDDVSDDGHGFGEISGSSLLASVAYRMAVLHPRIFAAPDVSSGKKGKPRGKGKYLDWAEGIRTVLGRDDHVTANGTVIPAVNPLGWDDTTPFLAGSPEGQNFVVLMYAAWRDCVAAGVC